MVEGDDVVAQFGGKCQSRGEIDVRWGVGDVEVVEHDGRVLFTC